MSLPERAVLRVETFAYRGKTYQVPIFDTVDPVIVTAHPEHGSLDDSDSPVLRCLNSTWDLAQFEVPRRPVSLGVLSTEELAVFAQADAVRVLDLPVKMPDCAEYR